MITYIKGDLIKAFESGEINIIAHQCNCQGNMGAGIAKLLANKYPELKQTDKERCDLFKDEPERLVGRYSLYEPNEKQVIYNIYSQYFIGSPKTGFDTFEQRLNWLIRALWYIKGNTRYLKGDSIEPLNIGIPLIASGLAKDKNKPHTSDLDYFQKYIASHIENIFDNLKVYYL